MRRLVAATLALASGCLTMDNVRAAVRDRAASDLRCDPAQLAIVHVEGDLGLSGFEVQGCGKRRSYAARCYVRELANSCDVAAASGASLAGAPPSGTPY